MLHPSTDLASHVVSKFAWAPNNSGSPWLVVAGGDGDNAEITGPAIDRLQGGAMADSAVINHAFHVALGESETLKIGTKIQESDDGVNFDTAEVIQAATTVATGGGGGTNESGVHEVELSLRGRKRYFRVVATPDFSASSADTGTVVGSVVLGGFEQLPR